MNLYELASRVIEAMEAERIPYMVVGPDQAPGFPAHGGRRDRAKTALGQAEGFRGRQGCAGGADTRQTGYGLHRAME